MNGTSLSWVELAIGVGVVWLVIEVVLRTLVNRYGAREHPHRIGTELPRVLK